MEIKKGLLYSKEHEWVRIEDGRAYIGITDYAQHNLGEIVYVELPAAGKRLKAGDALCSVDSIKAASDVYSPLSGTVLEANEELGNDPGKINSAPYESWIARIEIADASEADSLMNDAQYEEFCASEA